MSILTPNTMVMLEDNAAVAIQKDTRCQEEIDSTTEPNKSTNGNKKTTVKHGTTVTVEDNMEVAIHEDTGCSEAMHNVIEPNMGSNKTTGKLGHHTMVRAMGRTVVAVQENARRTEAIQYIQNGTHQKQIMGKVTPRIMAMVRDSTIVAVQGDSGGPGETANAGGSNITTLPGRKLSRSRPFQLRVGNTMEQLGQESTGGLGETGNNNGRVDKRPGSSRLVAKTGDPNTTEATLPDGDSTSQIRRKKQATVDHLGISHRTAIRDRTRLQTHLLGMGTGMDNHHLPKTKTKGQHHKKQFQDNH